MDENEESLAKYYGIDDSDEAEEQSLEEANETPAMQALEEQTPGGEIAGAEEAEAAPAADSPFARMIAQMQAAGFGSDDDIEAAMAKQQAGASMEQTLAALEADLRSQVEMGEITPEAAQQIYAAKAENLDLQAKLSAQEAQGVMAAQAEALKSIQSLDPALGQAAAQAGLTPQQIQALAPVLKQVLDKNGERVIAQYVAEKGASVTTTPIPQGGAPEPGDAPVDVQSMSFGDLFAMTGGSGRRR